MELLIQAWIYERKLFFGLPYFSKGIIENSLLIPAVFNFIIMFSSLYYCSMRNRTAYDFIKAYAYYYVLAATSTAMCVAMILQNKNFKIVKSSNNSSKKEGKLTYSEYIHEKICQKSNYFWLRWKFTRSILGLFSLVVFIFFTIWGILHNGPTHLPVKWRGSFSGRLIELHVLLINISFALMVISFLTNFIIRLIFTVLHMQFPKIAFFLCF